VVVRVEGERGPSRGAARGHHGSNLILADGRLAFDQVSIEHVTGGDDVVHLRIPNREPNVVLHLADELRAGDVVSPGANLGHTHPQPGVPERDSIE
jgi:hypothetical protein